MRCSSRYEFYIFFKNFLSYCMEMNSTWDLAYFNRCFNHQLQQSSVLKSLTSLFNSTCQIDLLSKYSSPEPWIQIVQIKEYDMSSCLHFFLYLFLLCFYLQGINFVDIKESLFDRSRLMERAQKNIWSKDTWKTRKKCSTVSF